VANASGRLTRQRSKLVRVKIPIACTLSETAALSQLDEWRDLLTKSIVATERPSPLELLFHLKGDSVQLQAIVRLAQREKRCCPFFDFAILMSAEAIALQISVPPEGTAILDQIFELAA
jgi:MerR family transcriptional regulator, copper efflux regulator